MFLIYKRVNLTGEQVLLVYEVLNNYIST